MKTCKDCMSFIPLDNGDRCDLKGELEYLNSDATQCDYYINKPKNYREAVCCATCNHGRNETYEPVIICKLYDCITDIENVCDDWEERK